MILLSKENPLKGLSRKSANVAVLIKLNENFKELGIPRSVSFNKGITDNAMKLASLVIIPSVHLKQILCE